MNLTYQTQSNIPEAVGTISSVPGTPDIANNYAGGLSEPGAAEMAVIARIPDLDAPATPQRRRRTHSSSSRTIKSAPASGRVLGAGVSMKLLIGLGLVLMVGAVAPYMIQLVDRSPSKTGGASDQAWQPPPPAPTADLAPSWKPQAAQGSSAADLLPKVAEKSVASAEQLLKSGEGVSAEKNNTADKPKDNASDAGNLVRWDSIKAQPTATIPAAVAARSSPWPRDTDGQADFSPWPNPAHPILAEGDARRNEPYTADRRNAPAPGGAVGTPSAPIKASNTVPPSTDNEAGEARFEGTINTTSDRNTYDRSRPSIH